MPAGDGLGVVVEDGRGEERNVPSAIRLSGKVEWAALELREGLEEESNEGLYVLCSSAARPMARASAGVSREAEIKTFLSVLLGCPDVLVVVSV